MKILCVSAQALFPGTRFGGAKRLYYLVQALERHAEVDLVHFDGCDEIDAAATFATPFRRQLFLPRERPTPLERAAVIPDAAKAVRKRRAEIAAFVGDTRYDATLLLFPSSLYFLAENLVPHPGRIMYLEDDLHLERLRADARTSPSFAKRLLKRARVAQTRRFYRKALARVSGFVCISEPEAAIARREWGLPTRLLGYGIPLEEYPELPVPEVAPTLGFIGHYRHAPNLDAARWLATALFPAARERFPDARLLLCGPGMPESLRAECARVPGVEVLGEVADLKEFYGRVTLFANAIREGRGLRTKVVEAAAYGRPVLSTRLGAEGLETFTFGDFETPEEFARAVETFADRAVAAEAARHNRSEVERLFSLEAVGAQLLEILIPGRRTDGSGRKP